MKKQIKVLCFVLKVILDLKKDNIINFSIFMIKKSIIIYIYTNIYKEDYYNLDMNNLHMIYLFYLYIHY